MRWVDRRVAAAYHEVVAVLGSDFATHPPRDGRCVTVTGADGIPSSWELSFNDAERLIAALRGRHDLRVTAEVYSAPEEAES